MGIHCRRPALFRILLVAALSCPSFASYVAAPQPSVAIAKKGVAKVKIAYNASDINTGEKAAVNDLKVYLGRVIGGEIAAVDESSLAPGDKAIYVGNTAYARALGPAPGGQTAIIKTVGGNLILYGGRPKDPNDIRGFGVSRAVYLFLEKYVRCRWYTSWDEKVPSRPDLTLPSIDLTSTPKFRFRIPYFQLPDQVDFMRRNRMHEPIVGGGFVHTFSSYFDASVYQPEHPEYASMGADGQRHPAIENQFCMMDPGVREIVLNTGTKDGKPSLKRVVAKNPNADYFEVSQNDTPGYCVCPKCKEIEQREGTPAGPLLEFINFLADGVKDQYPNAQLRTLAYWFTEKPPLHVSARPNVTMRLAISSRMFPTHLPWSTPIYDGSRDVISRWNTHCSHIEIWDYDIGHNDLLPVPSLVALDTRFKYYSSLKSMDSLFCETEALVTPRAMIGLRHWVMLKLMDDPTIDLWSTVADFCNGVYGAAGPTMVEYARLLEANPQGFPYRYFTYDFLSKAQDLMYRAAAKVTGDPAALRRVREQRFFVDLATLMFWSKAWTDHVREGHPASDWRFDKAKLIARTEHYLDTLYAEHRWLQDAALKDKWQAFYVDTIVDNAKLAKGVLPLPKELAGIPTDRIVDLPAPVSGVSYARGPFPNPDGKQRHTPDPDAVNGVATVVNPTVPLPSLAPILPFELGVHNPITVTDQSKQLAASDITSRGYHLYNMGSYKLTDLSFLYMPAVQTVALTSLIDYAHPDRQWTVYVSLKFEGPHMPFGNPDLPDSVYIDRVILVKDI